MFYIFNLQENPLFPQIVWINDDIVVLNEKFKIK